MQGSSKNGTDVAASQQEKKKLRPATRGQFIYVVDPGVHLLCAVNTVEFICLLWLSL